MSSLLLLQNKDVIMMASDTASSIKKDGVSYRVANNENKIFEIGKYTIFASGTRLIRDIFINMLDDSDTIESIQQKLINFILPSCGEYSLGVVIGLVERDYTKVVSLSSYNKFEIEETTVRDSATRFFSAGIRTKEVYSSFEKFIKSNSLLVALEKTYKENSCEEVGGKLDIYQITHETRKIKEIQIDNHEILPQFIGENPYVSLIFGEYVFGKLISGVNLYIEDESGVWKTQGSRTTIYDRNGIEKMWLGLVSNNEKDGLGNLIPQAQECFGLVSWNDSTKVEITDCAGVAISRWKNSNWEKVFWANTDGTLYTKDMVAERIKIVNNVGDVILDAENNYFNIGLLSNIVADGKLTTLEKLNLVTELYKVHVDYKNVLAQAEKYNKSSRDITYNMSAQWNPSGGFPVASINDIDHCDTTGLVRAYTELMNYMTQFLPITNKGIAVGQDLVIDLNLTDSSGNIIIERTDVIADRGRFIQVFRDYNDESDKLKRKIEDSLFYSGINMGSYYNNIMIGEQGFVAVRSDGKYRAYLNATNGLALEKWESNRWVKKLYASLGDPMWEDGTLIAEGLVTKNLRIVDANMNDKILFDWYDGITILGDSANIYLNANDAIRITDKSGDSKFWVDMNGFLYAKDITTHNLSIVDGNLGEKIVFDHQDGISIFGDNADIFLNANDAIRIRTKSGEDRFWVDTDGFLFAKKLYIMGDDDEMIEDIDGSYISDLTVNSLKTLGVNRNMQDIVFIKDNFIRLNTHNGTNEITKFDITFNGTGSTSYPVMTFGETAEEQARIYKDADKFAIEYDVPIAQTRFLFNKTDSDDEGQAVYFESQGGVRFHSDNKFVAKTALDQYIRVTTEDARMQFKKAVVLLENNRVRLQFDETNYIEISASGIKMIGTRIDLN